MSVGASARLFCGTKGGGTEVRAKRLRLVDGGGARGAGSVHVGIVDDVDVK